jgi:hypothetical protein
MDLLKESLTKYEYIGYENIECKVIRNVLSQEECLQWINDCEQKGFEQALINDNGRQVLNTDVRLCDRCFIDDDKTKLDLLYDRLSPYLKSLVSKQSVSKQSISEKNITEKEVSEKEVSLNPRLRFLKYYPGHYFMPHYDQNYRGISGKSSEWTIQIYLNENFKGGETTFIEDNRRWRVPFRPETGSVILFHQSLLHEGSVVKEGIKYTVRTDVLIDY